MYGLFSRFSPTKMGRFGTVNVGKYAIVPLSIWDPKNTISPNHSTDLHGYFWSWIRYINDDFELVGLSTPKGNPKKKVGWKKKTVKRRCETILFFDGGNMFQWLWLLIKMLLKDS